MKRLLLTAFEPFAGESINPSLEAARQMEKVSFPGALVRVAELPVDRYRAIEISLELIHVPYLHDQAINKYPDVPSLSRDSIVEAVRLAIEVSLSLLTPHA